jgi:hypothetical protein
MHFTAKDRMLLYTKGKTKAEEIGVSISNDCSAYLISDGGAQPINTTKIGDGVYIAAEPGYVSTGIDEKEVNLDGHNKRPVNERNQMQQTVAGLTSNMICIALVNWYSDFKSRLIGGSNLLNGNINSYDSGNANPNTLQYNSLDSMLADKNSMDREFKLFKKYLAIAMKTYQNQFDGNSMINP